MILKSRKVDLLLKTLIITQFVVLVLMFMQSRTSLLWVWATISFIPATVVCLKSNAKKYVLASLILLFVSQHSIFLFANQTWGYGTGSDSINDFHIASVISGTPHFDLGRTGYAQRPGYSYYPLLHVFSVVLNKLSSLPLAIIALYLVPILNAVFVAVFLFHLNQEFFGLHSRVGNIATLFFAVGWYYTVFSANFTREVFAFPFVLLTLLVLVRTIKRPRREYAIILPLLFVSVILAHQVSSYVLLVLMTILTITYYFSRHQKKLFYPLILYSVMLMIFTSFVAFDFTVSQGRHFINAFQTLFDRGPSTLLVSHESWRQYLTYLYYSIIGAVSVISVYRLLREKKDNRESNVLVFLFGFVFVVSVLLRLSLSADPWSWAYYMSLRGTIWAFIGISVLLAIGFGYVLKLNKYVTWKNSFTFILIISILAVGKFSQNPLYVSDSSIDPSVTLPRYQASMWLLTEAPHGSNMLVAPASTDLKAFESSRSMAPYAFLREYFLDTQPYDMFNGYIPMIGGYFDRYQNQTGINIVYCNAKTQLGFKSLAGGG